MLGPEGNDVMDRVLPGFLKRQRWFGGAERRIRSARIRDALLLPDADSSQYLALIQVEFNEGDPLRYFLGVSYAEGDRAVELLQKHPQNAIARVQGNGGAGDGVLYDSTTDRGLAIAMFRLLEARRRFRTGGGDFWSARAKGARALYGTGEGALEPTEVRQELNHTSVVFSNRVILKILHPAEEGPNPDVELGQFLAQQGFEHVRRLAGLVEYRMTGGQPMAVATLHNYIPNAISAWRYTLDDLSHFYERTLTSGQPAPERQPVAVRTLLDLAEREVPELAHELIGPYLESVRLLAQRTAEMHLMLASQPEDPLFGPEAFTTLYQRSVYQSLRTRSLQVFPNLRRALDRLPEATRPIAEQVLSLEPRIRERYEALTKRKIAALRVRHHADYHLDHVLYTGKDFVITNFEGSAARPLSEERIKRSPIRDVAGMLRSFQYAACGAWLGLTPGGVARAEDRPPLEPWARFWCLSVGAAFVRTYLETMGASSLIPKARDELETLLDSFVIDRAVGQLADELSGRPDWLEVPLRGILELLEP